MSARDPFRYFRLEARELLDALSDAVAVLSRDADPKVHRTLMRHAHTLKGAASVVGVEAIGEHAHALESLLEARAGQLLSLAEHSAALELIMAMRELHAALPSPDETPDAPTVVAESSGRAAPAPGPAASASPLAHGADSVRVELERLRRLGEQLEDVWAAARALREELDELGALGAEVRGELDRTAAGASLARRQASARRHLAGHLAHLERDLGAVSSDAAELTQVACSEIFDEVERAARDASALLGRPIAFVARGGEVRVDPQTASVLRLAFLHAARNTVAHGIEAPEERAAAGKPALGSLTIEVIAEGSGIIARCSDDGRGVDESRAREALIAAGHPGAARLEGGALHRALLGAAVSTRDSVDAIAGRGVGLGAITAAAHGLRGEVRLQSEPGRGAQLILELPVSVSSLPVLHLEDAGHRAVLPIRAVRATLRVEASDVTRTDRHRAVSFESTLVPLVPLRQILGDGVPPDELPRAAVIVEHGGARLALGVDRCLGIAAARVRPVPRVARPRAVVAGAALAGRGAPQLLLSPAELVETRRHRAPAAARDAARRRRVLLIDDSLTTRMLEEAILVGAGYEVVAVASGEAALERAGREPFDLFVVDVDMPGMDGVSFVRLTRADPALRATPALMVTSRATAADRERAAAAGAAGYMVKSEFDQRVFLERVALLAEGS